MFALLSDSIGNYLQPQANRSAKVSQATIDLAMLAAILNLYPFNL